MDVPPTGSKGFREVARRDVRELSSGICRKRIANLSKGCLSYARISEARGISLVLENAAASALTSQWIEHGERTEEFLFQEIQYISQGIP